MRHQRPIAASTQLDVVPSISGEPAWAAILFAPTLVGTVYGMKFDDMPELAWGLGYPVAVALMGLVSLVLYVVLRRRD